MAANVLLYEVGDASGTETSELGGQHLGQKRSSTATARTLPSQILLGWPANGVELIDDSGLSCAAAALI
jgi:hypothetical protein